MREPGRPPMAPGLTAGVVVACLCLGSAQVHAQEQECAAPVRPELVIVPVFEEVTTDNSRYAAELDAIRNHPVTSFGQTVGLTRFVLNQNVAVSVGGRDGDGGKGCYWLDGVEITYGVFETVVLLARELGQGTCERRLAWGHEMTHVAIAEVTVERWEPQIREAARQVVDSITATEADGPEQAAAALLDELGRRLDPSFEALDQDHRRRQQAIDTPQEYARLSAACD